MKVAWLVWMIFGVLAILGGVLALANPFAAALAVEQFIAWTFLLSGFAWLISLLAAPGWGAKILHILVGAIVVWIGIALLANPLAGMVSIAVLFAVSIGLIGVLETVIALNGRHEPFFWPVLLSGLLSIGLSILIATGIPAFITLSVILAIQLIGVGTSMIGFALWSRKAAPSA